MPLSKEEKEHLARLQEKANEPPERRESINVDFVYDPDDVESVKKGISRGHLTKEDVESWGWDAKKLGFKDEPVGEEHEGEEEEGEGGRRERSPRRRSGYFTES